MAKSKKKSQTHKASLTSAVKPLDENEFLNKYFWLVIPVLAVVYYLSSKYSPGFYQDDEIGHFLNMQQFWKDPFIILGNWPKPGYKLFMVIPSLFGYQTVIFFNSLIASVTVYLTYLLLKAYNIRYAFFGALLLAFQPLFFDLSFRSYAEIFTALLFVAMIIFYRKESYFLCGLVCGYIFTVRQEIALVGIFLAIIFYTKKNYAAILSLAIFPALFFLFGYLKSGDPLYVMHEMSSLGALDFGGAERGFFHYFKVYIFIIGPVTLALLLLGYFGFFSDTNKMKEYLRRYDLPYIVFTLTFLVQAMLMVKGVNPGTWRYLLHISPIAAFFATAGLNNLALKDFRKTNYIITGILIFITIAVLSKTANGLDLTNVTNYGNVAVIGILLFLTVALYSQDWKNYLNKLSVILLLLSTVYFFISFEPRKLSPENLAVKQIAEYVSSNEISGKIYVTSQTTGPMFLFGDLSGGKRDKFIHLNSQNLSQAQKGDIVIWDSHYGYRPEYNNDVKIETLQQNPDFKLINTFTSGDNRYQALVFEKVN